MPALNKQDFINLEHERVSSGVFHNLTHRQVEFESVGRRSTLNKAAAKLLAKGCDTIFGSRTAGWDNRGGTYPAG